MLQLYPWVSTQASSVIDWTALHGIGMEAIGEYAGINISK